MGRARTRASSEGQTPMVRQYLALKKQYPDCLLLYRMGDFYETFFEDARRAAEILGITLTTRGKDGDQPIPLAGVPWRQLDTHLHRLVRAGVRVAVAEQMEDPRQARGLVERDVVRIVTAGTLTEDSLLQASCHNYLAAVQLAGDTVGLAWVDLSTGRFEACDRALDELPDELARLTPAECLVAEGGEGERVLPDAVPAGCVVAPVEPLWFGRQESERALREHFGVLSLEGFGAGELGPSVPAAGAILAYLAETQKTQMAHITGLRPVPRGNHVVLDRATLAALEITEPLRGESRDSTLLGVLDRTCTAPGARLLRTWLLAPLRQVTAIHLRQEAVGALRGRREDRAGLRAALRRISDLERLSARISTLRATPRDLASLGESIQALPDLTRCLAAGPARRLEEIAALDPLQDLGQDLARTLVKEPTGLPRDGGVIAAGVDPLLDELRDTAREGKSWIARMQQEEARRSGIPSLKVGYHKVFGYYLEVPRSQSDHVPEDYVRRQTLAACERFTTPALKEQEARVLSASDRAVAREVELFEELRRRIAAALPRVLEVARQVAELDVLASLAEVADERGYVCPEVDEGLVLDIRAGRHPVLDAILPPSSFVPNDLHLDVDGHRLTVLTGPNMAGKSTYIRQVALLVLMAQMGSFLPARSARIGVVDRVFARIGAADELARGNSTFMVEMTETANILRSATERSLVVLDEVGRGTSTTDGLAIAWAVTEHLHDGVQARTLFATHYHELTEVARHLPGVRNQCIAVEECGEEIVFLHAIREGGTDQSYGIHVARLAGIPPDVIGRAREVLASLQQASQSEDLRRKLSSGRRRSRRRDPEAPGQGKLFR